MTSSPSRPKINATVSFPGQSQQQQSSAAPSTNAPSSSTAALNASRHRAHSASSDDLYDEDSDSSRTTTPTVTKSSPFAVAHQHSSPSQTRLRPLPGDVSRQPPPPPPQFHQQQQQPQSPGGEHSQQQASSVWQPGHRPRQHSQGFFEPSLPSASTSGTGTPAQTGTTGQNISHLTTSQLAAQAAMHTSSSHNRKRSQTLPDPAASPPPQPAPAQNVRWTPGQQQDRGYQPVPANPNMRNIDGFIGGHSLAAATAAFPRSPQYSPGIQERSPQVQEKESKMPKEKSKMKLFSKPKSIGIYKDKEKDVDKRFPALPSPGKISLYSSSNLKLGANASTTSLVTDPSMSSANSIYSNANSSTSTLVPIDQKEKHKHHFFPRQKKPKDREDYHLPLSSASSTSKPTDPNAPQPLYSFAPSSSPANASSFAKSVSGLDLRHGGRALREKKKEEKAGSSLGTTTLLEPGVRDRENSFSAPASEWPGAGSYTGSGTTPLSQQVSNEYQYTPAGLSNLGSTFGVPGITGDDAWPLLKARLLHIFEAQDLRPPIEDFNALVLVHLRRCIQRRSPTLIIEDLTELLQTGFLSLDQTLHNVPDERLVPHLVAMWTVVFNTILPFMQAVFLPLDLEFKGRGSLMTQREAAEFWGVRLSSDDDGQNIPILGEDLDVRRITLQTFRDTIFLPRFDVLMGVFSRLSLESVNAGVPEEELQPPPPISAGTRPGTASSTDAALQSLVSPGSFSNSSTTHLESNSPFSMLGSTGRSRATSNTSAGSFHSNPSIHPVLSNQSGLPPLTTATSNGTQPFPPTQPQFPAQHIIDTGARLTETVGRMLQCVSVLASVQSGDDAQAAMEKLTKTLKWNWLGRGRTGRQRRGFVGTRVRTGGGTASSGGSTGLGGLQPQSGDEVEVRG